MKINVKGLDVIAGILLVAWLVSVMSGKGGLIHTLLLTALGFISIRVVRYRREHQE